MELNMEKQQEGPVARAIEKQTSRIPSDFFLWTGIAAIATSAGLMFAGQKKVANFVAQWVPTVLLFGVYNKLVKQMGHDIRNPTVH